MKKVMFTGDSVTDEGRARPIGYPSYNLGNSYVGDLFIATHSLVPPVDVEFYNSAISGYTSRQLREIWEKDVLAYKTDFVFIEIGINDCWRDVDYFQRANRVSANEFKENVSYMIETTIAAGSKPVLITPFILDINKEEPMRKKCDELIEIEKELAEKYNIGFINIQEVFDKFLNAGVSSFVYSPDRVHPRTSIGETVISNTIFNSDVWQKEVLGR